ncbi:Cyclin-dependent kinase 11B [Gracilariopsis chorda]|uniref:Cyclin-dependent kinase 11B n=1 Tax=Gracilariopsis chorda TaxID=448386 RepID=A0A2V3J6J0_9FLOR|nr:Cyclin-dependent kinase 11B [Gracilariopsis chorda]|eukprot:PXF50019.1 Cyclin-dependent kinase 11B [Gracilariopsis chorda]
MSCPLDKERPCRSVECYERLNFIDEGTYGRVFRARDIQTGQIYALKQVKLGNDRDGFPVTALREISTLFSVNHPNVVRLREVVVGSTTDKIYLVMEYAEHDLLSLLERMKCPYSASEIKSLMQQLLRGVAHLHDNWILHRDLKPSNLLLTGQGVLKVCDFGLARNYGDPLSKYTQGVVTLWYRAPELLMGSTLYSTAVDMWAIGCIFAELVLMRPLLQGKGELDQLAKIASMFGAPSEKCWGGFSKLPNSRRVSFRSYGEGNFIEHFYEGTGCTRRLRTSKNAIDLMQSMLLYDPEKRISAADALRHPYFSERPSPKDPSLIQTFPDDRRGT